MQEQFQNLKVWQKGIEFVKQVYKITLSFPKEEQFGLTSQIRRAAVSIPLNIAEGKGRYHKKEYIQFLYMARGSVYEVMTLLHLALELGYLTVEKETGSLAGCGEIAAMLNGLIRSIS